MSTTKRQLAEQINRILQGGDISDDAQIDPRELYIAIGQNYARFVKDDIIANRAIGQLNINGDYITAAENIAIKEDVNKGLFYSDITVKYLQLPEDLGLYQVSLMKEQDNPFIRMSNGGMAVFNGLPSNYLAGNIGFWPEKDRIYYHNFPKKFKDSTVLVKVIASIAEFGADEEVPIPADKEGELVTIVLQLYGVHKQTPQDKINDNKK